MRKAKAKTTKRKQNKGRVESEINSFGRISVSAGSRSETKYTNNTNIVSHVLSVTGAVTSICVPIQGDTVTTRTGDEIRVKRIEFAAQLNSTATTVSATASVYLIWDSMPNGVVATIADIFDTTSATSSYCPLLVKNIPRFTIMKRKDFTFTGGATVASSTSDATHYWRFSIPVNHPTRFLASTGAGTDVQFGAWLIVSLGSNIVGATAPLMVGLSRAYFTDS